MSQGGVYEQCLADQQDVRKEFGIIAEQLRRTTYARTPESDRTLNSPMSAWTSSSEDEEGDQCHVQKSSLQAFVGRLALGHERGHGSCQSQTAESDQSKN